MDDIVILGPETNWRAAAQEHEKANVFLIGPDGFFRIVRDQMYTYARPVNQRDLEIIFQGHAPSGIGKGAVQLLTQVPFALLQDAVALFSHLAAKRHCEGLLLLYYLGNEKRYELIQPRIISCGHGHVEHEIPVTPPDWWRMGSFHSHPDEPAYQSREDQRHDVHNPGLHIIIGDLKGRAPSLQCYCTTIQGQSFPISPADIFAVPPLPAPPAEWIQAYSRKGNFS